ncbi:MAG: hypothetical protein D6682_05140 [Zetaproteobacteria bacterium]|nr:MAG: hypothetical protein D6682_05140 [Zetaproteobacteria bacterium]
MSVRISSVQPYNNLLQGINRQTEARTKANANIAAGTRFQTPAQAGLDYKISLDLRQMRKVETNAITAAGVAESRLSATQVALMDMERLLSRAQVLAVQHASANVAGTHAAAAVEVKHLLDQAVQDANQQFEGQYLFSGTATDTQPWTVNLSTGTSTYNGSTNARTVQITETQTVVSNELGNDPAFQDTFNALIKLYNGLNNSDQAQIQSALGDLNTARDEVVKLDTSAGAKLAALRKIKTAHEEMKAALDKRINTHEAVDIPKLVSDIQLTDVALQASYKQVAAMSSLSLVNFLR